MEESMGRVTKIKEEVRLDYRGCRKRLKRLDWVRLGKGRRKEKRKFVLEGDTNVCPVL